MLSNIVIQSATVTVGGEPTVIHGLSFMDVASLLIENRDSLAATFSLAERLGLESIADIDNEMISKIGFGLLAEAPELVGRMIAIACGEPDEWYKAMQLPAPAQLNIMRAIARLTMVDELSFGEFAGNVVAVVTTMKKALPRASTMAMMAMKEASTKTETK